MSWKTETFGNLLTESKIPSPNPDTDKRIRVRLNVKGVEKRPDTNDKKGATKQYIRKAGQFIYGKQNFHKGAFGIIPPELDNYETSSDIPSFDVREDCLPEWIYYYFKAGNRYLELVKYARGVGSKRIHPKQIVDLEIPLPSLSVQRDIIDEVKQIENDELSDQLSDQLNLVTQLRQAFLREAMQGKLTEDWRAAHPELIEGENSASALLERIKAEKEQLIREKKIRKPKPIPQIEEEEIPFLIPDNWVWTRLGEFAYVTSGSTPKSTAFVGDGIPFLKMYNLRNQRIDFFYRPQYILEEVHNGQLKRCRATPGDLIMNIVGPPLGKLAIIPDDLPECNFNQAAVLIRPTEIFINRYLFYYLSEMSEINYVETKGVAGQNNISVTQAHNMKIPLPPLIEQKHIVAKLDEIMSYCDSLEESIRSSQVQNELLLGQVLREALEG